MSFNSTTAGDLGDVVCVMAVLSKQTGEKHKILLRDNQQTKGIVSREYIIRPLVESQSYVEECRPYQDGDNVNWPTEEFRNGFHCTDQTLVQQHANHGIAKGFIPRLKYGDNQWLFIEPSNISNGRIVINRTERYPNQFFPWKQIVSHYGNRLMFVGNVSEHRLFQERFGDVEYYPTQDLLKVGELIAGSSLFIGNQSSPMAIAEGLKHPSIQETSLSNPDCIYLRPNCQHVIDGSVKLPDVDGSGQLHIEGAASRTFTPKTHITPPGNWQFNGAVNGSFTALVMSLKRGPLKDRSDREVEDLVLEENYKRLPDYFRDRSINSTMSLALRSMENAKLALARP